MKELTCLPEWQALKEHQKAIEKQTMQQWFAEDPLRFQQFSLQVGQVFLDYSKNRLTQETVNLLCGLARATDLENRIQALITGKQLNSSEKRPALHTALRQVKARQPLSSSDILLNIQDTLLRMQVFSEKVRNQHWHGATGKPIKDIVNIGIGGSHLGPLMAVYALSDYAQDSLKCHFISNIDSSHINRVLKDIDPEATLFIISSKSFTTLETMANAKMIYAWMQQKLGRNDLAQHFVAVTAAKDKAVEFGIPPEQIFPLWDWVGGRFSVWSAIGMPLSLMIGMDKFLEFLDGGFEMDHHFCHADFSKNMPVILALLGIWYINFFDAKTHAIVPYSHQLNWFRAHLQQLDMESNGKRVTHTGNVINYASGPIIWGEHGGTGQHAFHQLLHQGQHLVPVDFILAHSADKNFESYHDILIASCLSQAEALMRGKTVDEAYQELINENYSEDEARWLAQHKSIPGNRPSNILFLNQITPRSLGNLLALYEHKVFVQGAIWDINSFDQWGVELGKQLLPRILKDLRSSELGSAYDASTAGLINHYKKIHN